MSEGTPEIQIQSQSRPHFGWRSTRVRISGPDLPTPITVTVHWRDSSTCYIGFRRFNRASELDSDAPPPRQLPATGPGDRSAESRAEKP
jgi:hypothetical protein